VYAGGMGSPRKIVMIGSSGAVGGQVVAALAARAELGRLTLLGRRGSGRTDPRIVDHLVDALEPSSYREFLAGHDVAICTLGVGEPSKVSRADFIRIDKDAVLGFAGACRDAGVTHFELLASVGADPKSRSFYLRSKGELSDGLRALGFQRLSLFHPSMILTPTNRYGMAQAVTLAVWPKLRPILCGPLRAYRGIAVEELGRAMANNVFSDGDGEEVLLWDDFTALAADHP